MLVQKNCTSINTNSNNASDCAMTINTAIQIILILNNTSISDNTKSIQQYYL